MTLWLLMIILYVDVDVNANKIKNSTQNRPMCVHHGSLHLQEESYIKLTCAPDKLNYTYFDCYRQLTVRYCSNRGCGSFLWLFNYGNIFFIYIILPYSKTGYLFLNNSYSFFKICVWFLCSLLEDSFVICCLIFIRLLLEGTYYFSDFLNFLKDKRPIHTGISMAV